MTGVRSPSDLVVRGLKPKPAPPRRHRLVGGLLSPTTPPVTTGTLTIKIVCASIFEQHLGAAPPPDLGRLFVVTIAPQGKGSKRKVLSGQGAVVTLPKLKPGTYQIDVVEQVWRGVFQKYPAASCMAVVSLRKTTTAYAVLATDTLSEVAARLGVKIGVQSDVFDKLQKPTLQYEFNLASPCIPPGSVQAEPRLVKPDGSLALLPNGQPASPSGIPVLSPKGTPLHHPNGSPVVIPVASQLSAPIAAHSTPADIDANLKANGWDIYARFVPTWDALAAFDHLEILPTPVVWFTASQNQIGVWLKDRPLTAHPPPHEIVEDHARTLVRWFKKVITRAQKDPTKVVRQWVALNEMEDMGGRHGTKFWGGIDDAAGSLRLRRVMLAKHHLHIIHHEDPGAILLINDFHHEFYAPSGRSVKGKLGRQISLLRSHFERTKAFHETMQGVLSDGALRGKVGAGYQMHFKLSNLYLENPALYRKALQDGITNLRRVGSANVTITEMALSTLCFLPAISKHFTKPPDGSMVGDDWHKARDKHFLMHGYAGTAGTRVWRKQAQVFRDIVKTFLLQPDCKTLIFWSMVDVPYDEVQDVFGHLFDAPLPGETIPSAQVPTQGVYAGGLGCPRKPAYFGVLNGLIDVAFEKHKGKAKGNAKHSTLNWMRRWSPPK